MKLTNEQKRLKIAEACGWKYKNSHAMWLSPSGQPGFTDCPDYLNDLNAMHEAWKSCIAFKDVVHKAFLKHLRSICEHEQDLFGCWDAINATAAQRAEAFGRTLNLW